MTKFTPRTVQLAPCFPDRFRVILASRDGMFVAAREIGVSYDHLNKVRRGQVRPSALLVAGLRSWLGDEAWNFCAGVTNTFTMPTTRA
jgi:hypothetical protein